MKPVLKKACKRFRACAFEKSMRAVSLFSTLSHRRQVFSCFYVKPLVRYYHYFYMSDHMNAIYNVICICCKIWVGNSEGRAVPIYCHRSVNAQKDICNF